MGDDKKIGALKSQIDELDMFLSDEMSRGDGNFLPSFAIAIALIDAGVISRARLLEIVDAIIDYGATQVPAIGQNEQFLESIETLRTFLEGTELKAGNALDQIRILSSISLIQDLLRRRRQTPKREPPKDGEPGA
jgi:hypothetical protein